MHVPERRRKPRVSAEFDVRLDGHSAPVRVRDISASGVRCETDRPLPVMTQVRLVLVIPAPHRGEGRTADGESAGARHEIVCRGAVVRSEAIPPMDPPVAAPTRLAKGAAKRASKDAAAGRGAHREGNRRGDSKYDTAIFFTDMREADRIDVEELVSAAMRSG